MRNQRGFAMTMALYLIGAVAIMAVLYGVYWKIDHSWETTAGVERGAKDKQKEWDAAVAEQRAKEAKQIDTATTKLETDRVKTRTVFKTITRNVDRLVTRDVYKNVCLDADGLKEANNALAGVIKSGEPSAANTRPP